MCHCLSFLLRKNGFIASGSKLTPKTTIVTNVYSLHKIMKMVYFFRMLFNVEKVIKLQDLKKKKTADKMGHFGSGIQQDG